MINGEKKIARPFRWGIVGGGRTSQVGYKHRLGALMDNTNFELVAAAFDIDPERCVDFGRELNMDPARCYPDYKTLFAEARRSKSLLRKRAKSWQSPMVFPASPCSSRCAP